MDYYNQIDPYNQEQLPYQPRQEYAPRQYIERPILERPQGVTPSRMSKAEAVALVEQFKKWLVVASLVGFGVLAGLVGSHSTGVTSAANQQQQPGDDTTQQQQPDPSQSQDNGGFFQQQQQQQGGYGFGPNSTQQPPVSGSRAS